ncbi:MAG: hypothetical protein NC548_26010 [Lachnospiraceae bacterium]|nr:hypothetical protein [Lachnospiraceae bacterium]
MAYNADIDNKDVQFIEKDKLIELSKEIIQHIDECYSYKPDVIIEQIQSLICACKNTIEKEVQYGTNDDEKIYTSLIQVGNYRIRVFYDCATNEDCITINEDTEKYLKFSELKDVLVAIIDEYVANPKFEDDVQLTLNGVLCSICYHFGELVDISEPCECCGDRIHKYEMEF